MCAVVIRTTSSSILPHNLSKLFGSSHRPQLRFLPDRPDQALGAWWGGIEDTTVVMLPNFPGSEDYQRVKPPFSCPSRCADWPYTTSPESTFHSTSVPGDPGPDSAGHGTKPLWRTHTQPRYVGWSHPPNCTAGIPPGAVVPYAVDAPLSNTDSIQPAIAFSGAQAFHILLDDCQA